ncbi:MAG TPA: phosphoribosylanthranilate isomerase [Gemmatimonas sp.]|nr:phosphoribosylanthranilate isomerase [Gemmatimonas sp.]
MSAASHERGNAPVAIKICGLTRPQDALRAEAAGASFLGVILAGGPRLLDLPTAARVLGPRRAGVQRVAVFGAQSTAQIVDAAAALDLDVVQLHGDPTPDDVAVIQRQTERAVWPVLRVEGTQLPHGTAALAGVSGVLVLDAHVIGQLGGTGVALDWSGLADSVGRLREEIPLLQLVVAGGLRPRNVSDAIRLLAPDVVDVSSGVESTPGVKDPEAIECFVNAVRRGTRNDDGGREG